MNHSQFSYGELPPHPIEAKKLKAIPEGWEKIGVISDREVYEPTPSNKTRAEQLDEALGADSWGLVRHELEDGSVDPDSRMLDIVASKSEGEASPHEHHE